MRVANPEAIKKGEEALATAIASNFDKRVIQKIFKRVHNLDVGDDIRCKHAAMGVHGDDVVYSMDFEVLVNLSVFLDRSGDFISISSSGVASESSPAPQPEEPPLNPHAGEMAGVDPQSLKARETVPPLGGSYEEVLKEFAPIDSEFEKSDL